jgi:hypothetical protein
MRKYLLKHKVQLVQLQLSLLFCHRVLVRNVTFGEMGRFWQKQLASYQELIVLNIDISIGGMLEFILAIFSYCLEAP